ncbi:MAG: ATP-binding protein [archaeon]|nr:ATP-binding protein [archaeon]
MSYLKVTINQESGEISVENGGKGIPIEIHKDHGIYVPELIFGNLLTSSNYNDNVKKVTGGRNGYGAKLTNIFSKEFIVETADKSRKKKYKQRFYDNMLKHDEPKITDYKKEDFTKITFTPDLEKFKMETLDEDIVALFKKRVYDMAGITPSNVSVFLNGEKLKVKNFNQYIAMFLEANKEKEDDEIPDLIFEAPHERWEVGFSLSETNFQQVSYVNGICTSKGGTHVNYVVEKIVKELQEVIEKKEKNLTIKPMHIKQHMFVFVNCLIENPAFDSQTKETLTLKRDAFGSSFEFSDAFIKKIKKSGIVDRCLTFAKTREEVKAKKKLNKGSGKTAKLFGIDKLDDANDAGTKNSDECTLIVTEGDSAKSLAVAGINVVGK